MLTLAMSAAALASPDARMSGCYDRLAGRLLARLRLGDAAATSPERPWWVAIAGGPGAGKSSLASAVCERVNAVSPGAAVVLPMDGFHYSRAELRALGPPDAGSFLPRRGSPWTFDAEGLCASLTRAKAASEARLPVYCRVKSDPVPARF